MEKLHDVSAVGSLRYEEAHIVQFRAANIDFHLSKKAIVVTKLVAMCEDVFHAVIQFRVLQC